MSARSKRLLQARLPHDHYLWLFAEKPIVRPGPRLRYIHFLNRCKEGTIQPEQFNTWLVQDFFIRSDLPAYWAELWPPPPNAPHLDTLLGGVSGP